MFINVHIQPDGLYFHSHCLRSISLNHLVVLLFSRISVLCPCELTCNPTFQANYVLESDELLETVRPEFDIILCLSITKWIHLNWGDSGLKRFFRRIYHNLKPGGRLVLEPQGWPSYNKRRKLTVSFWSCGIFHALDVQYAHDTTTWHF